MNRQLKAKLKYVFMHSSFFQPNTFTFEKNTYRIVDKKKLRKIMPTGRELGFIIVIILIVILRIMVESSRDFFLLILLLIIVSIVYDWFRLPKDIFPYLEKIEKQ